MKHGLFEMKIKFDGVTISQVKNVNLTEVEKEIKEIKKKGL